MHSFTISFWSNISWQPLSTVVHCELSNWHFLVSDLRIIDSQSFWFLPLVTLDSYNSHVLYCSTQLPIKAHCLLVSVGVIALHSAGYFASEQTFFSLLQEFDLITHLEVLSSNSILVHFVLSVPVYCSQFLYISWQFPSSPMPHLFPSIEGL